MLALLACGPPPLRPITVDGSSTVFPITEAVAEEFRDAGSVVPVTVGVSGTGGGMSRLCVGEVDIANASRPIRPEETAACGRNGIATVEVPIAFDGLAVVVHPENDWAMTVTTTELRTMWEPEAQGRITRWSQVRPGWPDVPLHLYGPGVDSGTYDHFTAVINGREHASRGDFTASEDDNVLVTGVAGDEGALGFFGLAYYAENAEKLRLVAVDAGGGPHLPSPASVRDGRYSPLSRPLFLYVSTRALERPEVDAFVRFYLHHAPAMAREVGYVPLPDPAYVRVQARVDARRTGSVFAGRAAEIGLEALLADPGGT